MELKNYAHCVFAAPDQKLLTVDFADLAKRSKEHSEKMEKLNPPSPQPVRVEYNRLRKQLYDLQQGAKHAEVFCNCKADEVKGLELRINDLLKEKKKAIADGRLGDERNCEHRIQLLETELLDAQHEFMRAIRQSIAAARAERAFDGHARIAELQKELDKPLSTLP